MEVSEAAESKADDSEKMDDSIQFVPRRPTSLNVVPGPRPGPLNNSTIDLVSSDRNATVDLVTPSDGEDTKPLK